MSNRKILVSVIGGHKADADALKAAERTGEIIAEEKCVLVCGGLTGIMEAVCKGAKNKKGLTVGIIPGEDKRDANQYVDVAIATGMGFSRNTLVAGTADIVVALPGEYGTLSEIGFALNAKKPVYGFDTWDIKGVRKLKSYEELRDVLRKAKGD
ncbi:MAG: TIGR00725 family protein [Candidatus Omnitrophica bacterium]|nr:TIGR00725 family protein [Candidatus Omnitrophota bacterium]